jgi:hypothetical protein
MRSLERRAVCGVGLSLIASCSFAMQGVDPKWNHKSAPKCDTGGTVMVDRVFGIALIVGASTAYGQNQNQEAAAVALSFAGLGVIYELAAVYGAHRAEECQSARTEWRYSNAIKPMAPGGAAAPAKPAATPMEPRPWATGVPVAEQATALQLYAAGNDAFVQNRYADALAQYKQAIAHWDHPAIRFNMVVCLLGLGAPVEARDSLEHSLVYGADALGPDAYAQALRYRDQLDRQLVRLTLDCPEPDEAVALDGERILTGPGQVTRFLAPGDHQVVATKPGFLPASRQIILAIGQPQRFEIRPLVDPRPR